MPRLTYDMDSDDVRQWLDGGYYLVRTKQGEEVARFIGINEEGATASQLLETGLVEAVPYEDCIGYWPECGSLNIGSRFAVYLERRQRRQWRRTFNHRCLTLRVPRKWDALRIDADFINRLTSDCIDVVREAFNPTYMTFREAARQIQSGLAFSRAINPHIILVGDERVLLVYYRGELAARIESDRLVGIGTSDKTLARIRKMLGGIPL